MFFKVSLKKNLPAFIFSSVRISYVIVDSWCRECYHTNRNFSNLKYEFFKENVSIFNVQYVLLTGKGTSIRKTVRNYVPFLFSQYNRVFNIGKKNTSLRKNIRCGNTTELWKSNKSMKILCAFVILCKEMKIPGYTLRS